MDRGKVHSKEGKNRFQLGRYYIKLEVRFKKCALGSEQM